VRELKKLIFLWPSKHRRQGKEIVLKWFHRSLVSDLRTNRHNVLLGIALAFVAGATNAGGFLAVGRYTSHMTGLLSSIPDNLAVGQSVLALGAGLAICTFVFGAATTSLLVHWARRRRLHSLFALPLMLEALFLLLFGLAGATLDDRAAFRVPFTMLVLTYLMGLQNAVITKISRAEIRTTHVTGLITDLGIELGKFLYTNHSHDQLPVRSDRRKVRIQISLVCAFLIGGLVGANGFKYLGYVSTVPLALILVLLAYEPVWQDMRSRRRLLRWRTKRVR
jgi:uncharacterized membrane protein YoaK (UPF0700 family)